MIYLEIAYAQKDEAKPFGVRWDPKKKLWYFPGDVLPKELERFRPAKIREGLVGSWSQWAIFKEILLRILRKYFLPFKKARMKSCPSFAPTLLRVVLQLSGRLTFLFWCKNEATFFHAIHK